MKDYLIFLYRYFAKFVPEAVLTGTMNLPEYSAPGGYSEVRSELLTRNDECTLPIKTFVFSSNETFVSDSVKSNDGYILFVEYGEGEYDPNRDLQYTGNLAVTIARPYTMPNNDALSEIIINNGCLNMLNGLLDMIYTDITSHDGCCLGDILKFPVQVKRVDPKAFFDNTGFVAYFNNVTYELK